MSPDPWEQHVYTDVDGYTRGLVLWPRGNWVYRLLSRVFRYRDILAPDGRLYLRRWFLTPRRWALKLFLHCFFLPDQDRVPHDHPFDFLSVCLSGFYVEESRHWAATTFSLHTRSHWPGAWFWVAAEHVHQVTEVRVIPTWTLILARRARREWGFITPEGWRGWRAYLKLPETLPDYPEDDL